MSHRARKRFGQNFLVDTHVIHQIVSAISPQNNQKFVEIGPGKGALTELLLETLDSLDVIELDRDLIPILENRFPKKLKIHQADVLKFDFSTIINEPNLIRVVGNLPYNISTPLLFHLLHFSNAIFDMHFMLQKEVVERIASPINEKSYGRLSVIMQYYFNVEQLFNVKPSSFKPAPKVDSAIIRLIPYKNKPIEADDESTFQEMVKLCFTQRRKTLRNNLKQTLTDEQIEKLNIDSSARAETLSIFDFVQLSNDVAKIRNES